jgi:hypothetical protein
VGAQVRDNCIIFCRPVRADRRKTNFRQPSLELTEVLLSSVGLNRLTEIQFLTLTFLKMDRNYIS